MEPTLQLDRLCGSFMGDIYNYTYGVLGEGDLYGELRKYSRQLKASLYLHLPTFQYSAASRQIWIRMVDSEEAEVEFIPAIDHKASAPRPISFDNITEVIERKTTFEAFQDVPWAARKLYMESTVSLWEEDALNCFKNIQEYLQALVKKICAKHFKGRFQKSGLFDAVELISFLERR